MFGRCERQYSIGTFPDSLVHPFVEAFACIQKIEAVVVNVLQEKMIGSIFWEVLDTLSS